MIWVRRPIEVGTLVFTTMLLVSTKLRAETSAAQYDLIVSSLKSAVTQQAQTQTALQIKSRTKPYSASDIAEFTKSSAESARLHQLLRATLNAQVTQQIPPVEAIKIALAQATTAQVAAVGSRNGTLFNTNGRNLELLSSLLKNTKTESATSSDIRSRLPASLTSPASR